jgi:hypothetical protein
VRVAAKDFTKDRAVVAVTLRGGVEVEDDPAVGGVPVSERLLGGGARVAGDGRVDVDANRRPLLPAVVLDSRPAVLGALPEDGAR